MTLGFDQLFGLTTAFTAKDSTMAAAGDYKFGGTVGFGLHNGSPSVHSPTGFTATQKLSDTMKMVSIGPASLIIEYAARFTVGVGLLGFHTGVWFQLTFSTGLTGPDPPRSSPANRSLSPSKPCMASATQSRSRSPI
jgi:hypothetical protein